MGTPRSATPPRLPGATLAHLSSHPTAQSLPFFMATGTLVGEVLFVPSNELGCGDFPSQLPERRNPDLPLLLLVKRGDCFFVEKVGAGGLAGDGLSAAAAATAVQTGRATYALHPHIFPTPCPCPQTFYAQRAGAGGVVIFDHTQARRRLPRCSCCCCRARAVPTGMAALHCLSFTGPVAAPCIRSRWLHWQCLRLIRGSRSLCRRSTIKLHGSMRACSPAAPARLHEAPHR